MCIRDRVYTQPGISHMISSLEKEMGFPLLIRGKDGVFPTENAKPLIYYMQQIDVYKRQSPTRLAVTVLMT